MELENGEVSSVLTLTEINQPVFCMPNYRLSWGIAKRVQYSVQHQHKALDELQNKLMIQWEQKRKIVTGSPKMQ